MAHFARLDENNFVIDVTVIVNEVIVDDQGQENEQIGIDFCKQLFGEDTKWIQASYNGNIRGRYPGIGFKYDSDIDKFVGPKPYPSWTLDPNTGDWVPPIPKPQETQEQIDKFITYMWSEEENNWITRSLKGPINL